MFNLSLELILRVASKFCRFYRDRRTTTHGHTIVVKSQYNYTNIQMQGNPKHRRFSVVQVRNVYLLLDFSFSTRGERDTIFTMLTVPTSPTVNCPAGLARPRVGSQLTAFLISPNFQPIASGYDVIHTPVTFPIWGFYYDICDCHILCALSWTVLNVCAPALRTE